LGNAHARARAVSATDGEWILFVDDDTELAPDYVEQGLRVISDNPGIGCFGGKLLLPDYLKAPKWVQPLLPFLAIKNAGPEPITACVDYWGIWEPPSAGAFVRRPVLERYLSIMIGSNNAHRLGRKGRRSLNSGEDSLMMRGAHALGLAVSYQPSLSLTHHLDPRRFRFKYLLRLMHGYGRSQVILERVLAKQAALPPLTSLTPARSVLWALYDIVKKFSQESKLAMRYACCMLAFRIGYFVEQHRPQR